MNTKQVEHTITISAEKIESTDSRFTMDDLTLGDNYRPLDVYYQKADGEVIRRKRDEYEEKICNRTLPKLIIQIFE